MNYFDAIKQHKDDLYDFYRVKIHVGHLVGGAPKDPNLVTRHLFPNRFLLRFSGKPQTWAYFPIWTS